MATSDRHDTVEFPGVPGREITVCRASNAADPSARHDRLEAGGPRSHWRGVGAFTEWEDEFVTKPAASVIIPVRDMASLIGHQLAALAGQDLDESFEVLVADNGSTDETVNVVRSFSSRFQSLRILDASARSGPNFARNVGCAAARSDRLVFTDADDLVEPGWLRNLVRALDVADAAGGRIRVLDPHSGGWGPAFTPTRMCETAVPRSPIGTCAAVRRTVWADIGGFDEGLPVGGGDETEFFWRLQALGYRLVLAPDAVVRYRTPSDQQIVRRKEYRAAKARMLLLKWYGLAPTTTQAVRIEAKAWASIGLHAPAAVVQPHKRAAYLRTAAKAAGRMSGRVEHRRAVQRFPMPRLPERNEPRDSGLDPSADQPETEPQ